MDASLVLSRVSALAALLCATACGDDEPGTVRGSDIDVLLGCSAQPVCDALRLESSEGQPLDPAAAAECVLPSLRDRVPGRYLVTRSSGDQAASSESAHALIVSSDGSVKHAYKLSSHDGSSVTTDSDSEACQLVPSATLDACVAALKSGDPTSACLPSAEQGSLPWLESCGFVPATCD